VSKISRFEELEVWQKARELVKIIHGISSNGSFSKDFSLKDQINRSAGSVMDNVAEGFERGGNKEFIQFLSIAKGSAGEVRSQLYRALDKTYIEKSEFETLLAKSLEISNQLSGFITYLKNSELRGEKYVRQVMELKR
jgi:four helix bundle protein